MSSFFRRGSARSSDDTSNPATVLIIVGGVALVGGVAVFYHRWKSRRSSTGAAALMDSDQSKIVSLEMTDLEKSFYFNDVPPLTTVTWFKGDCKQAKKFLEYRMKLLLEKNPWLQGRLDLQWSFRSKLYLSYSSASIVNDSSIEEHLAFVDVDNHSSPISRGTPIAELGNFLRDYMIGNGRNEPVFKITTIPCSQNPNEKFAVMAQMSHVVGDGATYYSLLNMLFSLEDSNIVALNPVRNTKFNERQIEKMGKDEAEYLGSFGDVTNIIRGLVANVLSSTPLTFQFGMVDPVKMAAAKLKAAKEGAVPYVSSNDVITSWFLQQVHSPLGFMAINWRNRLEDCTELDAGNYENVIFYRKEDSASPALIRQSLKTCRRVVTGSDNKAGVPGFCELVRGPGIGVVTNWSTFAKKNEILGCEEDFHVPVSSIPYFPTTMPLLLVFRAGVDQLGLCYFHTTGVNHLDYAPFLYQQPK